MSRFVPQDEGPRTQPWLNSYADLVTLLWTFFILLFSLSVVSTQRFQAALRSYFEAVGMPRDITDVLPGTPGSIVPGHMTNIVDPIQALMAMELEDLEKTGEELRQRLIEAGLVESVSLEMDPRGLVIRFADNVLFDLGSADLRQEAAPVLHKIAEFMDDLPNPVKVEGHTDDWPISTPRFPSNWELSAGRAGSVVRFFIESCGFDPARLQTAGYAEFCPIDTNETAGGRQKNRRVDVVVLRPSLSGAEPSPP